ncbi:MAG: MarR family transcriptional regulator [Thermoleophilia bacterium]|nr:MarR family transcriptional regulator [Thermoleophilia bacterium]
MSSQSDIVDALRRLLDAYDRLGVSRRQSLGLNPNEESALLLIGRGVTAPSEISRLIGMTTAGITNMFDRLEAEGLVRREPHETDRRRVLLTLTKRGFRSQLELESVHVEVASAVVAAGKGTLASVQSFLDDAAVIVEASSTPGDS